MFFAKRIASLLGPRTQQELRRVQSGLAMRRRTFRSTEPEFVAIPEWVDQGDWVLDLGANIGHYTALLSHLVGPSGRVIAVEPMSETFEILAANVARLPLRNVTLVNAAASDRCTVVHLTTPRFEHGLPNYYQSQIVEADAGTAVLSISVDSLHLPAHVRLVKIDVEGHELAALRGMRELLLRDRPRLIVEGRDPEVEAFLTAIGYAFTHAPGSPNRVYSAPATARPPLSRAQTA